MKYFFVNLKRFDVPASMGGICPDEDPVKWAERIIEESVELSLGHIEDVCIGFFFPEALLASAIKKSSDYSSEKVGNIIIGCQSVFRDDVSAGGNFGAFTSNMPASSAKNIGCTWSLVGHSEERKDKIEIMTAYDRSLDVDSQAMAKANEALNEILNREALMALSRGLNVLFCVGETAAERGDGSFEEQKIRIKETLMSQLQIGLKGIERYVREGLQIVIAYEPRWAIGPGKTPPGSEYIAYVTTLIKELFSKLYNMDSTVLYGGGLKNENAGSIGSVDSLDGGLVALTKFTQPISFDTVEFKKIIEAYFVGSIINS